MSSSQLSNYREHKSISRLVARSTHHKQHTLNTCRLVDSAFIAPLGIFGSKSVVRSRVFWNAEKFVQSIWAAIFKYRAMQKHGGRCKMLSRHLQINENPIKIG